MLISCYLASVVFLKKTVEGGKCIFLEQWNDLSFKETA